VLAAHHCTALPTEPKVIYVVVHSLASCSRSAQVSGVSMTNLLLRFALGSQPFDRVQWDRTQTSGQQQQKKRRTRQEVDSIGIVFDAYFVSGNGKRMHVLCSQVLTYDSNSYECTANSWNASRVFQSTGFFYGTLNTIVGISMVSLERTLPRRDVNLTFRFHSVPFHISHGNDLTIR